MTRHYLDHASTSPLRPEAAAAMGEWLARATTGELGDPGRIHTEGMTARHAVEAAREQVAGLLGARSREVVFTSGATEAVAAAVWGAASRVGHIVVGAVEHSAVRASVDATEHDQTVIGVDGAGRVHAGDVLDAVDAVRGRAPGSGQGPGDAGVLVCVQWGNHEVGTVQPIAEIVDGCRRRGALTLVDAAAAAGHVPIDFRALGADLLAVSAHKLGGPTGIGALLVRRGLRLPPLLRGGDQERARRAGMEHALGIVGFGAVAGALDGERLQHEAAEERRRTDLVRSFAAGWPGVRVFGPEVPGERLPHLVCLGFDDVEPQPVLLGLDRAGVAVHSGSSCSSEALEPSPVLEAMGADAHRSLRVSVGWSSTDEDVEAFGRELPAALDRLRALAARAPESGQVSR